VRWELRPRLFLRTSEFLWQEGHTAHATQADAAAYARRIHTEVYRSALQDVLAIPVLTGLKTEAERFAGATATLTCEGMMRDGKALQLATSHELGQNFARAFDITYTDEHGTAQHCWTTSWGSSTRMIGGLIMSHGDDAGLRLPPRVAPVQVILVAVKDAPGVSETIARLERELGDLGIRARADRRTDIGLGRRLTDWELKGVPVRIEVGPRDLANNQVTVVRRDEFQRDLVSADSASAAAVDAVQAALYEQAAAMQARRITDVTDVTSAIDAAQQGFARLPWRAANEAGERTLNSAGISIRCITTPEAQSRTPSTRRTSWRSPLVPTE
jgi:prolyl-tRNA synthetase